jgi:outer membrane receptor for ferrienterochelin and colicins
VTSQPALTTRRRTACSALAAIALSLCAASVRADEVEHGAEPAADAGLGSLDLLQLLDVEVSTATKTAETLADAPAIITVITAEDIERWGYTSVGEALQHVIGFYLIDDHILPNVAVRGVAGGLGAESGLIKVMIDGASVVYRSTSGNWLGVELIPLAAIQQIEVIRGPASALYGADAFLGVVNIITVPPEDIPSVSATVFGGVVGSYPGGQLEVVGGGRVGRFDLLLGAAAESRDRSGLRMPGVSPAPVIPAYQSPSARAANLERRSLVLHGRAGYRAPSTQLVLQAFASGIERGGDFAHWAQLTNGVDAQGRPVGTVVSLGQYRVTGSGLFSLDPALALSLQATYFQGGVLPKDRIEVDSDLFWIERKTSYQGMEGTLEARWTPSSDFNLIGGIETVLDHEDWPAPERISKDTGVRLGEPEPGQTATLTNIGVFVSSNWKLLDPYVKLTSGARFDQHSSYGSQITGRVGVTSQWAPFLVTKLLYGSAFKAPSPYLLYTEPLSAGDLIGEPGLEPQHVDTVEGQAMFDWAPALHITTSLSYSKIREQAVFSPQGLNQVARNIAQQDSLSWETRVDARYRQVVSGYASFEWIHSVRDVGSQGYAAQVIGDHNVVYPNWIARAGTALGLPSLPSVPLELGLQGILVGPRQAFDVSIVESGRRYELPSYLWLNASLAAPKLLLVPGHETTFAIRGKNLLGAGGPDPGFSGFEYPLAPRELMFEAKHTY